MYTELYFDLSQVRMSGAGADTDTGTGLLLKDILQNQF